ncbi:unnamed protein product [Dicrocoelium dendriticum]|nr:unnamed protein product [Dicrocoelium dendriticum]
MEIHTSQEFSKRSSRPASASLQRPSKHRGRRTSPHRKPQLWSTIIPSGEKENGEKVVSCLEIEVPQSAKTIYEVPIQHDKEHREQNYVHRPPKKMKQLSHEAWNTSKEHYADGKRWRYSEIFAPNSGRSPHMRARKSRSTILPTSAVPTAAWNSFFPFPMGYYPAYPPTACPRCRSYEMAQLPRRSVSHDCMTGYSPHMINGCCCPVYPTFSAENLSPQPRGNYALSNQHHHHHHCHFHTDRQKSVSRPLRLSTQNMAADIDYEDTDEVDVDGYEGVCDVMEIEYAVVNNDNEDAVSAQRILKQIVKLTKQYCIPSQSLDEQAKRLKLALDARYDEKWHVVISNDSFGSDLACLPGSFANFRINERVFLVWKT